jgi:hypothetical protein
MPVGRRWVGVLAQLAFGAFRDEQFGVFPRILPVLRLMRKLYLHQRFTSFFIPADWLSP